MSIPSRSLVERETVPDERGVGVRAAAERLPEASTVDSRRFGTPQISEAESDLKPGGPTLDDMDKYGTVWSRTEDAPPFSALYVPQAWNSRMTLRRTSSSTSSRQTGMCRENENLKEELQG